MRSRFRTIWLSVGLVLSGACLTAVAGSSCSTYALQSALASADFCFIFDCQNGILGGTIDPCARAGVDADGNEVPLFIDCPEATGP